MRLVREPFLIPKKKYMITIDARTKWSIEVFVSQTELG